MINAALRAYEENRSGSLEKTLRRVIGEELRKKSRSLRQSLFVVRPPKRPPELRAPFGH